MKRKYKIIFCSGNAQSCVPKKEKNTFENWIEVFWLRKLDIKIRSGEKDNTLLSLLE